MPLKTVEIELSELEFYVPGARFMAAIAYPDDRDEDRRQNFFQALVRWTMDQWMRVSPDWAQDLQVVRPGYFSGEDKDHLSALNHGRKRLKERLAVAQYIVLPHLRAIDSGRLHNVEDLKPTVDNMALRAAGFLHLSEGSVPTVKDKMWRPTKAVAHAVCAYVVWHQYLWHKTGRTSASDRQLAFLVMPELVEEVIDLAEVFRNQVLSIRQFRIIEEETIQFVAVRVPKREVIIRAVDA